MAVQTKAFKVASPLGLLCSIEAMEECIARKSHELPARQPSATPTTDAPSFPLSQLVMITRAGDAPLPESTDNGASEVRYIAELVPSSPAKEPQRHRTRLHARRAAWTPSDPNVFSDSDTNYFFFANKIRFFANFVAFSPSGVSFSPSGVSFSPVSTFTSLRQSS